MLGGTTPGRTLCQCGDNFLDNSASSSFEHPEPTRLTAEHLIDSPSRNKICLNLPLNYIKYI